MTGTTAPKPPGDGGSELPRPRRGSRWRWSGPHQALVAGGVLAAVVSFGVGTGGGRRRGHHGVGGQRGHHVPRIRAEDR